MLSVTIPSCAAFSQAKLGLQEGAENIQRTENVTARKLFDCAL